MKTLVSLIALSATLAFANAAQAQTVPMSPIAPAPSVHVQTQPLKTVKPVKKEDPHPLRIGFGMDIGVPSGFAVGVVVHPKIDWVSIQLSTTYNAFQAGSRASFKLDPFGLLPNCPIGLFVDTQFGFNLMGSIPGHSGDFIHVAYDYINFYGGLRLGKPNKFHWNFEVGPTYIHALTENFQSLSSSFGQNMTMGNPTFDGWLVPTFVMGPEVVWP